MEANAWRAIFESIRPEDQTSLVVRTLDSLEVAVEELARIETDVIMIRGRIAGTADNRRLFILPYDKLSSLYVNRVVASEEVDLFSPSIDLASKKRIAAEYYERRKQAAEEAAAPPTQQQENGAGQLKAQLDELKRMAEKEGTSTPPPKPDKAPLANEPAGREEPQLPPPNRLGLPAPPDRRPGGRLSLPEPPRAR